MSFPFKLNIRELLKLCKEKINVGADIKKGTDFLNCQFLLIICRCRLYPPTWGHIAFASYVVGLGLFDSDVNFV